MPIKTQPNSIARKIQFRFSQISNKYWGIKAAFRKQVYGPKIFCIGFNKTGTTSLGEALKLLGYQHSTFYKKMADHYQDQEIEKIVEYAARFDSFDDLPWFKETLIPILDQRFPGSKFIYLEREEAAWIRSFENWSFKLSGKKADMDDWLSQFQNHRAFVLAYFKDRSPDQFIILNISDKTGFEKLSKFLDKPVIGKAFPHFNKT